MFKNSKMASIFLVSAAIAILSILSAYLQFQKDKNNDAEKLKAANDLNAAYNKLQDKSDQLQIQSAKIIDSTGKITQLQNELIGANEKIEKLQEEVINQVTGGKVELEVLPSIPIQRPNTIGFALKNNGKYPVSDITITLWDQTLFKKNMELYSGDMMDAKDNSTVKLSPINSLASGDVHWDIYTAKFPIENKKVVFSLMVKWRNGGFLYHCTFERDDNGKIIIESDGVL
jgi:hypothetical protein